MSLMLFAMIFLLFAATVTGGQGAETYQIELLPTFIGYLIFWFTLEKRRLNRPLKALYSVSAILLAVTFVGFLAQIQFLFREFLDQDGLILGWILGGLAYVFLQLSDLVLLFGALFTGVLFFAFYQRGKQRENGAKQCLFSRIGMILSGLTALCDLGALTVILPFSWKWISYPLSILLIGAAYLAMKDDSDLINGKRN